MIGEWFSEGDETRKTAQDESVFMDIWVIFNALTFAELLLNIKKSF